MQLQFFRKENTGLRNCKPALLGYACTTSQGKLLLFMFRVALNLIQVLEQCYLVTVL